ncbi:MAG: TspO/MBR family protein [Patescibacteria group bacterium]
MNFQSYYLDQNLPPLAPPAWLFGVVWPILYILIIISYGWIFYKAIKREVNFWFVLPFLINIIANILFTFFQFGLRNNTLALIDILIVLVTIIITITLTWDKYRLISYMQFPYLAWVSFATYLQIGITILNR